MQVVQMGGITSSSAAEIVQMATTDFVDELQFRQASYFCTQRVHLLL